MTRTLRVLHVDRSVADAERIKAELERGGVKVQDFSPDVVLCDHANEHLDAKTALRAVQLLRPAVPVIWCRAPSTTTPLFALSGRGPKTSCRSGT